MKKAAANTRLSYLAQLVFDPKLRSSVVAKYLTNYRLVVLLLIAAVGFGIFGFTQLSRRLNPEISIAIINVATVLPGASPASVEELLTIPLERNLLTIEGLDVLSSSSQESSSLLSLQFVSSVTREVAQQRVQQVVDTVTDLPEDATVPRVAALDFEDVPVWQFVLSADGNDLASLTRAADRLERELELVRGIGRVTTAGVPTQEVQVVVAPERVEALNLQPRQLAQSIQAAVSALPVGVTTTGSSTVNVTLEPQITTIDSLRQTPVLLGQTVYRLEELALVQWSASANQRFTYVLKPGEVREFGVQVSVYKSTAADISVAQPAAEEHTRKILADFPTLELHEIRNVAADIDTQFSDLGRNFASTIALVFATLFIFLGIRQALVVSLSIPLTFLISFGIMQATGQTLNFLTLFSLLLALGLLVDDAIVAVSSITAYYRSGKFSAQEAGLLVWRDFVVPIFTTTITTVWAFLPLLLSTGIIGEFIKPIPIIVSSALLTSTSVAMLIALPTMIVLLEPRVPERVKRLSIALVAVVILGAAFAALRLLPFWWISFGIVGVLLFEAWRMRSPLQKQLTELSLPLMRTRPVQIFKRSVDAGLINLQPLEERFARLIERVIRSKRLRLQVVLSVAVFALFAYALVPLGFVPNEFFPKTDNESVYISIEMPPGTALQVTEQAVFTVLENIHSLPELQLAVAELGAVPPTSFAGGGSDATAAVTLRLVSAQERDKSSMQIAEELRRTLPQSVPNGRVAIEELSGGPPVGSDLDLKISGAELSELDVIAQQVEQYLSSQEGVVNIERSVKPGPSQLVFQPDTARLAALQLSPPEVAFWLRTALSGFSLAEVALNGTSDKSEVTLYFQNRLFALEEIGGLYVFSPQGAVPIETLGELVLKPSPSQITREQGRRTLTISASVREGFNGPAINQELLQFTEQLNLAAGYQFETGGVNEENQRSVQAILLAMVLSFILILATMVIQLGSFRQAIVVMLVIPLAVSGVFVLFALTGTPLSFPALIGILALFGIVVNNSIVLVDKINQNRRVGLPFISAISDASASRLEPILFSSLTTIIGLIPITLSDPLWQGLGGAIIAGLSISGLIMLFFIPVVYWWLFRHDAKLELGQPVLKKTG
jgi:multidrug efflux pump subunit AcrB